MATLGWPSPLAQNSVPMKSSHRLVPVAWAKCIAPAIRAWVARSQSRFSPPHSLPSLFACNASSRRHAPPAPSIIPIFLSFTMLELMMALPIS